MDPDPVDRDRQRRHQIGAQTDGSDEAVFDVDQRHTETVRAADHLWRYPAGPDRDCSPRRGSGSDRRRSGEERQAGAARCPEEAANLCPLPPRHPRRGDNPAIGSDLLAPQRQQRQDVVQRTFLARKRVAVAAGAQMRSDRATERRAIVAGHTEAAGGEQAQIGPCQDRDRAPLVIPVRNERHAGGEQRPWIDRRAPVGRRGDP